MSEFTFQPAPVFSAPESCARGVNFPCRQGKIYRTASFISVRTLALEPRLPILDAASCPNFSQRGSPEFGGRGISPLCADGCAIA